MFRVISEFIPAPTFEPGHPLQALVTNLDASSYVGRLAICRVLNGTIKRGQQAAWCRADGAVERFRVAELYVSEGLDRVDAAEAGPGEIIAIAGLAEVTIGETISDPDDPRPLPVLIVDEPSLGMTIGINTSPLSGTEGTKVTARLLKNRLDAELVGNVSIRLLQTDRPDTWEVQGRGELMEAVSIDVPEEFLGVVTQLLSLRKGRLVQMVNHGTGWARVDYSVPSRGLIGFRTEFLTETRGTGVLHHIFDRFEPWHGELRTRASGSLVADRRGLTTNYALLNLQDRGALFMGPGVDVYEGMIIGENARSEDMDVNPTKERKVTNIRSSTSEELVRLIPPRLLSLEQALEFIREDECVEATPRSVRLRKVVLDQAERGRTTAQSKRAQIQSQARASAPSRRAG